MMKSQQLAEIRQQGHEPALPQTDGCQAKQSRHQPAIRKQRTIDIPGHQFYVLASHNLVYSGRNLNCDSEPAPEMKSWSATTSNFIAPSRPLLSFARNSELNSSSFS